MSESLNHPPRVEWLRRKAPAVVFVAVCVCFLLSGFSALLYQTAWMRLFSTYFGTSEYAVTIVLASYMGGLALGAWLAGKYLHRIKFPILAYGFLELMIAVSALCVPLLMYLASLGLSAIVGGQAVLPDAGGILQPAYYLIASMFILGIPTACMGATLPILMRHIVQKDGQIGSRTGLLYGINTVGAVFGTVIAAFFLLPAIGMRGTVWLGVGVNILIYLIAIIIVLAQGFGEGDRVLGRPDVSDEKKQAPKPLNWILPLMFASGVISFVYEVLWTRLLGHVVGNSVEAFATMLAAFLTGIAIGGFLGGLVATSKRSAIWWFFISQVLIGLFSIYIYAEIDGLIPDLRSTKAHAQMAYAVMVPATIFIGMTFPLAVRIMSESAELASAQAARIYTWNTCGAVMGALLAGFVIIPMLGFSGTLVLCVIANLLIGLSVLLTQISSRTKWAPMAMCIALIIGVGMWQPNRPEAIINHSLFSLSTPTDSREEYYDVGRSATVLSLSSFNYVYYRSNGLPEANVLRKGASPIALSQQWLGTIPALIRPDAENMLVVGYGGGAALEAIPQHIESIDVIELEPQIIEANRATSHLRKFDPLQDERIQIVENDARNALLLSRKKFDIIVSQPSHPWTAGASHLFTKEYMALAKRRLKRDGVFLQWINAEFVNEALLRDLAATLVSEFKYVRMSQANQNALHFYASDAPLKIENNLPAMGAIIGAEPQMFANAGINSFYDVLAAIVLDERGTENFAKTGRIIRDDHNQLSAQSRIYGQGLNYRRLMELLQPYDPLIHSSSLKIRDMQQEHSLYVLGALVRLGMINRAWRVANTLDTEELRALASAVIEKSMGNAQGAANRSRTLLEKDQGNDDALFLAQHISLYDPKFHAERLAVQPGGDDLSVLFALNEAGQKGDWASVLDRDEDLINIPVTRSYAEHALYLRARSRSEIGIDDADLKKAMELIERSHLLAPSMAKLDLRAELADRLNDEDRLVNSLWQMTDFLNREYSNALRDPRGLRIKRLLKLEGQLDEYLDMLSRVEGQFTLERAEIVSASLVELKSKVSQSQEARSNSTSN